MVLLAWGALGPPTSAQAGCSRYAHPGPSLALLDVLAPPVEAPRPAERPRPCTGAMCSGQPAMPVSSTAPAPIRGAAWAILATPSATAAPRSSPLPHDERDVRAVEPAGSVFHPPRLPL